MSHLVLFLPLFAWSASIAGTGLAIRALTRAQVLDTPNERSNHKTPTPRGGGIAMIGVTLACYLFLPIPMQLLGACLLLAAISFLDDKRGLPASTRFLAQFVAVAFAMPSLPAPFTDALPLWLHYGAIALLWLWFINLTNFMDGIDGISALQTITMMSGIVALHSLAATLPLWLVLAAAVLAAAALGFLRYNLSPARVFMGDVGSIPLGFLSAYLLISLAMCGQWAAALILPAYYLTDATLTLLARAVRGEKIWQAHSQHAYQKAVRHGLTHNQVVMRISLLNLLLIALALASTISMMAAILTCVAGYGAALILVCHLSHASALR